MEPKIFARLGDLLAAEEAVLFLMPTEVVPQELVPDLAGYGFCHVAGDVVRELAELRHLIAGEGDGDTSRGGHESSMLEHARGGGLAPEGAQPSTV
ncbi:hypothetical protein IX27_02560 [Streptomyces sp. JS01]|nr:hypothetical protein IX27_02560 [Streptomyces sp. JS01]